MMQINISRIHWALICFVGIACAESSVIGDDFVDSENFDFTVVDTISIELNTIKFDSLPTSTGARLLIGEHMNSSTGDIGSEAYFLLTYDPSSFFSAAEALEFDSVTMQLPMDGYTCYLDEIGTRATIMISQLGEELELRDDGLLYNFSELEGILDGAIELGQQEFFFSSDRIKDLELRLDDTFGRDLLDRLKEEDEIYTSQTEFRQHVKGFQMRFVDETAPFVGFLRDSIRLTVYASDNRVTPPIEHAYDFFISDSPYYSKLSHENIPAALDAIETLEDDIPSEESNNLSFVNGGVGYAAKIELQNIRNVLLGSEDLIVVGMEIQLRWLDSDQGTPPDSLVANYVNASYVQLTGDSYYLELNHDDEFNRNNYYSLDITQLIDSILEPLEPTENSLLITLPDFNTSVTTALLGDEIYDSQLIIYTISNN